MSQVHFFEEIYDKKFEKVRLNIKTKSGESIEAHRIKFRGTDCVFQSEYLYPDNVIYDESKISIATNHNMQSFIKKLEKLCCNIVAKIDINHIFRIDGDLICFYKIDDNIVKKGPEKNDFIDYFAKLIFIIFMINGKMHLKIKQILFDVDYTKDHCEKIIECSKTILKDILIDDIVDIIANYNTMCHVTM